MGKLIINGIWNGGPLPFSHNNRYKTNTRLLCWRQVGLYLKMSHEHCCNTPHYNANPLGKLAMTHGHVTVQHCNVALQRVHYSITMNVTWRRFDQSAKRLTLGHTTNRSIMQKCVVHKNTPAIDDTTSTVGFLQWLVLLFSVISIKVNFFVFN